MIHRAQERPVLLLAEDDEDIRGIFEMVLAERYEIITAETGEEALLLARERRPDVVLLDWTLPDALGGEVLTRMRAIEDLQSIPAVVVSGANSVELLAASVGAIPCPKPCDIDQLMRAIERALQQTAR